jgi:hypothetical protein
LQSVVISLSEGIRPCYSLQNSDIPKLAEPVKLVRMLVQASINLLPKGVGKHNLFARYRSYAIVYKLNYNIHVIVEREGFFHKFFRSDKIKGNKKKNENTKK